MTVFVGLLRAVNVGGTGKLPMSELQQVCRKLGFSAVRTYIQSGNVIFTSEQSERDVKAGLEGALQEHLGKNPGAAIRNASEMAAAFTRNPFPQVPPNQVLVHFLDDNVAPGGLDCLATPGLEKIVPHRREVYVYYPGGVGRSKLKLPIAAGSTARNLNTVGKIAALMGDVGKMGETRSGSWQLANRRSRREAQRLWRFTWEEGGAADRASDP